MLSSDSNAFFMPFSGTAWGPDSGGRLFINNLLRLFEHEFARKVRVNVARYGVACGVSVAPGREQRNNLEDYNSINLTDLLL